MISKRSIGIKCILFPYITLSFFSFAGTKQNEQKYTKQKQKQIYSEAVRNRKHLSLFKMRTRKMNSRIYFPSNTICFRGNQTVRMKIQKEKTHRRARSYGQSFEDRNREADQSRVVERSQFHVGKPEDPRRQLQTTGGVIVACEPVYFTEPRRTEYGIKESFSGSEYQWLSSSHHWHRS